MPTTRSRVCFQATDILPFLLAAMTLPACEARPPAAPTGPVPLVAPVPSPPPPPPPVPAPAPGPGHILSGVLLDHTNSGPRPRAGSTIRYYLEVSDREGRHGQVTTDASGRYTIAALPDDRPIKLVADPDWSNGRFQRCVAKRTMSRDLALDLALLSRDARNLTDLSPTISGIVFETTSGVRKPVVGTPVAYCAAACRGMMDVFMHTGPDGYYEFCEIPIGPGSVHAGDCHDSMMGVDVDFRGTAVVDIDLTPMITGCPHAARASRR